MRNSGDLQVQNGLCCGLYEISGISSYVGEGAAKDIVVDYVRSSNVVPFVIFTSASRRKNTPAPYGEELKEYIEANKLGIVHRLPPNFSHTHNYVTVYVWAVDRKALRSYQLKVKAGLVK